MGSSIKNYPEITSKLAERGTGYIHMVFNSGFCPDGKRNRASESTKLTVKGNNQRKATSMMFNRLSDLYKAREITGIVNLKELLALLKLHNTIDNLEIAYEGTPPKVAFQKELTAAEAPCPLFSDVVEEWEAYHETQCKKNTMLKYTYAAKHIKEYFAGKTINEIQATDIVNYYKLKRNGKPAENILPLLPSTLKDHSSVLNMTFQYAKWIKRIINESPCERVSSPKVNVGAPDYFVEEELNRVFELIRGDVIAPAVILAASFGLRRQEAVGMKWITMDLENNTVTIRHTVTLEGTVEVESDTTKSPSSYRTLILLEDIKPFFVALKEYHKAMCKVSGRTFSENSYICIWPDGRRLRVGYVSDKWADFLAKNHMRHIRYHDLRHSSASLLRRAGLSLQEIQVWLGHADIKTTARYAHMGAEEGQQRIAQKVAGKLHIALYDGESA